MGKYNWSTDNSEENKQKDRPGFQAFINNCSTEAEKALEAWWVNTTTPIDSPFFLRKSLEVQLFVEEKINQANNFFTSLIH